MNLTIEDVRMLADLEHKMDSGEQPFVVKDGFRIAVIPEVMQELGLRQGQTITRAIHVAILRAIIAVCEAEIAVRDLGSEV